jgi:glycosyltransferase involved in cell wall biosynthesis
MKILFSPCHYIYDEYYAGSEYSWAFEIANRISSKNSDSVVVTGFKRISKKKNYKIIEVQKNKTKPNMGFMNAILFGLNYFFESEKQIKNNFDILHHVLPFNISNTFNFSIIFHRQKIPTVIGPVQSQLSFNDTDNFIKKMLIFRLLTVAIYNFIKPFLSFLSNLTLKSADTVVVINNHTKNILIKGGIRENKIIIIPPGIDTKKFKFASLQNKSKSITELLVVCHLVKRKAVDLVIKALNEALKENKNIVLRIVGDGPQKEALEKLVEELNLNEYVVFEGFVSNCETLKYYQNAHIFVSMTRSESWGQMYLEAMASGLPIITTMNIGSVDLVKDGRTGYLIEQENYLELSRKILKLINSKNNLSRFGENSRLDAEKKYDWDNVIIPKYLDIYNEKLF